MDYYDEIAEGYHELHGGEQRKKLALVKKHLKLNPADKVLDVGCGTGLSSDFEQFVVGIDPSFGLLKQNKKPSVQGKAEHLPFKDHSFDAVVCLTAIHHFDVEKALAEMQRVGKKHSAISVLNKAKNRKILEKNILARFPSARCVEGEKDVFFIL